MNQMTFGTIFLSNSLAQLSDQLWINGRRFESLTKLVNQRLLTLVDVVLSFRVMTTPARFLQGLEPRVESLELFPCIFDLALFEVNTDSGEVRVEILHERRVVHAFVSGSSTAMILKSGQ
jgi:hypothetical protein